MRLQAGAPDLAASVDGAYVVCAGERLTLYAQATRAELASAPLDGPADVAFVGADRLLVVVPGDGRSQLCGYALPSLELVATLELEGRLRVVTAVPGRALVATESLEQPRIVALTTKILVESIPLREPLLVATAAPEDRLLAASRTRDAQLECWDPFLRRALFRLNLPLLPRAQLAGFSARRRLLWIAAAGPTGTLEVFRFSDGRLQARVDLGAHIAGAAGHPESPRLIVATRPTEEAAVQLTELDFVAGERRELTTPVAPRAMCVVEGAQPALVLVDHGAPVWMALGAAATSDAIAATTPAMPPATPAPAKAAHPRVSNPADWRGKLHATRSAATAPASASVPATAPAIAPVADAGEGAPHWRGSLCDWAERQLAAPRRALDPPSWPDDSPLATTIARLALDDAPARALALVYGARLCGHAAVPAATVARALDGDDAAWSEALGHGLLARLGLARAHAGRLAPTTAAARFLDGAPARVPILTGGASDAELPSGNRRLDGGIERLADLGARLAERYGYDVALVHVDDKKPARMLAWKLVEARLHGAWPLIDVIIKAAPWADALDEGPSVVVVRGEEVPAAIAALPPL